MIIHNKISQMFAIEIGVYECVNTFINDRCGCDGNVVDIYLYISVYIRTYIRANVHARRHEKEE